MRPLTASRTLLPAALVAALALTTSAAAQVVAEHLACFRVHDPQTRTTYLADLAGLVVQPGCIVKVPATLACVPTTKTNVVPPPPGIGGTGTPNAFGCYKVKCRHTALPPIQLNDQFGNRSVTPIVSRLLCAPVGIPTTTTTSTSSSSTSTSSATSSTIILPPCTSEGDPCGSCGTGVCLYDCFAPGNPLVCVAFPRPGNCNPSPCPAGQYCVGNSAGPGGCLFPEACANPCP